jgi:hypothetical protein
MAKRRGASRTGVLLAAAGAVAALGGFAASAQAFTLESLTYQDGGVTSPVFVLTLGAGGTQAYPKRVKKSNSSCSWHVGRGTYGKRKAKRNFWLEDVSRGSWTAGLTGNRPGEGSCVGIGVGVFTPTEISFELDFSSSGDTFLEGDTFKVTYDGVSRSLQAVKN